MVRVVIMRRGRWIPHLDKYPASRGGRSRKHSHKHQQSQRCGSVCEVQSEGLDPLQRRIRRASIRCCEIGSCLRLVIPLPPGLLPLARS